MCNIANLVHYGVITTKQASKNKITVNPKTAKNNPKYNQVYNLTIFDGFCGLD